MEFLSRFATAIRKPWVPWVICIVCVFVATFAAQKALDASHKVAKQSSLNAKLIKRVESEGRQRRDQSCRGQENQHLQEVIDLRRTYRILKDPPPVYRQLLQNPIVLQDFAETIKAAQQDGDRFGVFVAPFCDEPRIGLKEPDPKVPEPPLALKRLFKRAGIPLATQPRAIVRDLRNK